MNIKTLNLLSILSLIGIPALCCFVHFSSDDFCYRNLIEGQSIFEVAWSEYMNWDGRRLNIPSLIQLYALQHLPAPIITGLWALSFTGTAWVICKILCLENSRFAEGGTSLPAVAFMSAILWLGMWKLIPDIIYWPTGGAYSLMALLAMLWLWVFQQGLREEKFSFKKNVLIFLLSFIFGNSSHNLVPALVILCLTEMGYELIIAKRKKAVRFTGWALTGLLGASFIVFMAPGNFSRLNVLPHSGLSPMLLFYYFKVLAMNLYWLIALLVLCLAATWLSGRTLLPKMQVLWKKPFIHTLFEHKYLLAGMATMLVFAVAYSFVSPRTGLFLGLFMAIYIFQKGWNKSWNSNSGVFFYGRILLLSGFLTILGFQFFKARLLHQKLELREHMLSMAKKGSDVEVNAITRNEIPFVFTFTDISPDTTYWVNRCMASDYKLKTIRTQ